ncbi:MAG TPA: right-handed parallel beta-helix repeat-containing protein [Geobacteraceae bacterium]
MSRIPLLILLMILVFVDRPSHGEILTADTVWHGDVTLTEDLMVPAGRTLTIRAGTVVHVQGAESTKIDPEYLSPLTELTIRGSLRIEGTPAAPVRFVVDNGAKVGDWAGVIVDGGTASLRFCTVSGAETGVAIVRGSADLAQTTLAGNRYGLVVGGMNSSVTLTNSRITDNEHGLVHFRGARLAQSASIVSGNRKHDEWRLSIPEGTPLPSLFRPRPGPVAREYDNAVLLGDTVWKGHIRVNGVIRVPEGSRLFVAPGTLVEFSKKDTNGDGIGEHGLLIQGVFIAKGQPDNPIVFRSAEGKRLPGDWDGINIMNSDQAENLVEHCIVTEAYRGLHFHFSRVLVSASSFDSNYRAIQFQESVVQIRDCTFSANRSGVQGRDSELQLKGNQFVANYQGANFFRCTTAAFGNRFTDHWRDAVRLREGVAIVEDNQFSRNRSGLLVTDSYAGAIRRNLVVGNGETGVALRNVDNLEVSGNYLGGNGGNGMNLQEVRAIVTGNLFAGNGERGVGIISFDGQLTSNALYGNTLWALDLEGPGIVTAQDNWWGGVEPASVILDRRRDSNRGTVVATSYLESPPLFPWPSSTVSDDTLWAGAIAISKTVSVPQGTSLTVAPGTLVGFAAGTGLAVKGKLLAVGEKGKPILFTAAHGPVPASWDEILLEQAAGSRLAYVIVEYATWGIHSHFTSLTLTNLWLRNNYGGLRFRSGPLELSKSRVTGNTIGIRAYLGNGSLQGNEIAHNEIGIFVREQGSGVAITGNNIFDNAAYNIRLGDFNSEDVRAPGNWWGTNEPVSTIFDARTEDGIGRVKISPFADAPLPLTGQVGP